MNPVWITERQHLGTWTSNRGSVLYSRCTNDGAFIKDWRARTLFISPGETVSIPSVSKFSERLICLIQWCVQWINSCYCKNWSFHFPFFLVSFLAPPFTTPLLNKHPAAGGKGNPNVCPGDSTFVLEGAPFRVVVSLG